MEPEFVIDILIIMTSGISLIMGLYMMLLYKNSKRVVGTVYWAAGSLLVGVGLLVRFIPPVDGFIAVAGPSLLITAGLYSYLSGIWQFKGKKIRHVLVIGLPALQVIQSVVFFGFIPSHRIRMVLYSIILIVYCSLAIYEMVVLPSAQKYLRQIFMFNTLAFLAYMLIIVARMFAIIGNPEFTPFAMNKTGIILFVISGFVMIALTFGFMSAVNLKLYKELEGQLKAKTKFMSIIGHDLSGPVGTIMGFLNVLNTKSDISDRERESFLQNLENISKSTFHLLQNLLEWSAGSNELARPERKLIDLNSIVHENVDFFRSLVSFKAIDLEFVNGSVAKVNANEKMLETVIRNIVSNAIKFTPQHGTIKISSEVKSGKVHLSVKDSGRGMPKDRLDKIFHFEDSVSTPGTDGESGSGFGLVLCKEFVEKNNGVIRIDSEENLGTEVVIEFPVVE